MHRERATRVGSSSIRWGDLWRLRFAPLYPEQNCPALALVLTHPAYGGSVRVLFFHSPSHFPIFGIIKAFTQTLQGTAGFACSPLYKYTKLFVIWLHQRQKKLHACKTPRPSPRGHTRNFTPSGLFKKLTHSGVIPTMHKTMPSQDMPFS